MPALSFMKQFVNKILSGEKIHTIRRQRKYPIKLNDRLVLYTGMRIKNKCTYIAEKTALYVANFEFDLIKVNQTNLKRGRIKINNKIMKGWSLLQLAKNDGFDNFQDFKNFFIKSGLPFIGQIIGWSEDINYNEN